MERDTIYFYDEESERVKPEHIYLNNFAHSPIIIDGLEFQTVEHFYQASKFTGEDFEAVRLTPTPDAAKKLAYQFELVDVEGWEEKKDSVMLKALQTKFEQHPDLLQKLLETGNARLVEDSDKDSYWGGILEGSRNRLGELLESIREKYLNSS